MLLAHAGEEQFFEAITEIMVVITDSHDAVLDDVGHNLFNFSSTFYTIVWEKGKCYIK